MEEEKAAAYYDELTRKGEGAARFKQGLGFSAKTSDSNNPTRGSAFPSSSSFLSNFVKGSSESSGREVQNEVQKQSQLENIQNKLKKKQDCEGGTRVSDDRKNDRSRRHRSRSRERDGSSRRRSRSRDGYDSRRRNRSSSRDRDRDRDRERRIARRSRSRSRSSSREERRRGRSSKGDRDRRRRSRSRSRSSSRRELRKGDEGKDRSDGKKESKKSGGIDYSRLIRGYEEMTAAERVKAKIKLQLSQTAEKDMSKGMGAGWERFQFDKDAPLDDEEMEVAEDDAALVTNIGQSFRFTAVKARKEEEIKAAHDEAMFGAPAAQPLSSPVRESVAVEDRNGSNESTLGSTLISDKVLEKQSGSWRDRARKLQGGSKG